MECCRTCRRCTTENNKPYCAWFDHPLKEENLDKEFDYCRGWRPE